jgi:predicted RNase H-like nuclease (RuvC/YqgF family)
MITITAYTKSATDSETKMREKLSKMDEANRKLSRQVIYLLKELNARNGEIEALKAELEKVKSEAKVKDKVIQEDEPPKEAEREYILLSELAAVFDDLGKQFENLFNKHEG